MQIDVYLNFPGHCLQAFRFYEEHLGGRITMVMTHGQGPNAANLPPEQRDAILHARGSPHARGWTPRRLHGP